MSSSLLKAMKLIDWQVRDPAILPYAPIAPQPTARVRETTYCWIIGTDLLWRADLAKALGDIPCQVIAIPADAAGDLLPQDWLIWHNQSVDPAISVRRQISVDSRSPSAKRQLWQDICRYDD